MKKIIVAAVAILFGAAIFEANAQTYMLLPIVGIVDGDTITTDIGRLPIPLNRVKIRIKGMDTPEKNHLAKCPEEKELGLKAKAFLEEMAKGHTRMKVENYEWDKWGGRIAADVKIGGKSVKDALLEAGLAKPYDGGTKPNWCE